MIQRLNGLTYLHLEMSLESKTKADFCARVTSYGRGIYYLTLVPTHEPCAKAYSDEDKLGLLLAQFLYDTNAGLDSFVPKYNKDQSLIGCWLNCKQDAPGIIPHDKI